MQKVVILFTGLPGVGKTTIATKLSHAFNIPRLTSELIRSSLLGKKKEDYDIDFSKNEVESVYRLMYHISDELLSRNQSVIVDGVFRSDAIRQQFMSLSNNHCAQFIGLYVICSEQAALRRLAKRKAQGTVSPSGPKTYDNLKSVYEAPSTDFWKIVND